MRRLLQWGLLLCLFLAGSLVWAQEATDDINGILICEGGDCGQNVCEYAHLTSRNIENYSLAWVEIMPINRGQIDRNLKVRISGNPEEREGLGYHPIFGDLDTIASSLFDNFLSPEFIEDTGLVHPLSYCKEAFCVCHYTFENSEATLVRQVRGDYVMEWEEEVFRRDAPHVWVKFHLIHTGLSNIYTSPCISTFSNDKNKNIQPSGDASDKPADTEPDSIQKETTDEITDPEHKPQPLIPHLPKKLITPDNLRECPDKTHEALKPEDHKRLHPIEQEPQENSVQQAIRQMCDMTVSLYKDNLHAMVDEGWKSPKPPHKGTWTAVLKYDILRNGAVSNVRVVKGSGYAGIDHSAVQRVYQLQGTFRPLPSCYDKPTLEVDHTFKVIYR